MLPILLGLVAAGVACVAYAALIERNWFVRRSHVVPCLPSGAPPMRILHISDLHFRQGHRRKKRFLQRCAETQPDLVVCTGDFLDHEDGIETAVAAVGALKPRVAAMYVLGSHDYVASKPLNPLKYLRGPSNRKPFAGRALPWEDLVARLEQAGWTLMINRATTLEVKGLGTVDVVGLDDPHIGRDDLSVASPRTAPGFRLGIVHSPDGAPPLAELGYDLIVCGHTHGGQLRVPGFGALVTNSTLHRRMARGLHPMNGAWLHVSAGLGTSTYAPVRFACRPEVCVLELVERMEQGPTGPARGRDEATTRG